MIALIQRVVQASVTVESETVAATGRGLLALIGIERDDNEAQARRLLQRLLNYRVFSDADGRMNLSLRDTDGDLLLVPQFTLAADTGKGLRPSFTPAAAPEQSAHLFNYLLAEARAVYGKTASGRFGAHMQVSLVNDGPVTFWLKTSFRQN